MIPLALALVGLCLGGTGLWWSEHRSLRGAGVLLVMAMLAMVTATMFTPAGDLKRPLVVGDDQVLPTFDPQTGQPVEP